MIHNSHFEIINQFLGNYNREIYGRELIGKVSLSQKNIALTLDRLEQEGILTSRKKGNLKLFKLNTKTPQTKDTILLAEITRKIQFMNKNPLLTEIFKKDDKIIGIFGSYAKGTHKKDSDIDIFTIGEKTSHKYTEQGKLYDYTISIKQFTAKEFKDLTKKKNPLAKEIIENHIMLFNTEKFIDIIWSDYNGFD